MTVISNCQRCEGSGVYRGTRRDGSTYEGACFACQGGGPRFVRRGGYRPAPVATMATATATLPPSDSQWTPRQRANVAAFAAANPAAYGWLIANRGTMDFAASLLSGCARYGGLTPRQLAAVERNLSHNAPPAIVAPVAASPVAARAGFEAAFESLPSDSAIGFIDGIPEGPDHSASDAIMAGQVALAVAGMDAERAAIARAVPAPASSPPLSVNLDLVRTAMESARASGLRKVRLTFGEVTMKLSGATFRSGPGMILCYFRGTYRGYVDAANRFVARYGSTPDTAALVAFRLVGENPRAAAETHGHQTGNCACCRRLLTDPPSVMAGIGPVCIRRFGWSL